MNYTKENPPENWKQYPVSFLNEAVPILNQLMKKQDKEKAFTNTWDHINVSGLGKALKQGACPEIEELTAVKKSKTTEIKYKIKGSQDHEYFISVGLYSNKKHVRTLMMGYKQLESDVKVDTDEDLTEIHLNVRLSGFNEVSCTKTILLNPEQGSLNLSE
jgi:formylmethanofuran dehydrogenase subunit B